MNPLDSELKRPPPSEPRMPPPSEAPPVIGRNASGKSYNGFLEADVTEQGCVKDSILVAKKGIMTRGDRRVRREDGRAPDFLERGVE